MWASFTGAMEEMISSWLCRKTFLPVGGPWTHLERNQTIKL